MRVLIPGRDRITATYACHRNYHVRRSLPDLDDLVTRLVISRLARPDVASALARTDDGGAAQDAIDKVAALRARLDTAADAYANGTIDGAQLARITSRLRPELERWQHNARAASTAPDLLDLARPDIADRWHTLPLARQRAVIDLLMSIKVLPARPGRNFDPNSVCIEWKSQP